MLNIFDVKHQLGQTNMGHTCCKEHRDASKREIESNRGLDDNSNIEDTGNLAIHRDDFRTKSNTIE
jgi:hypothetical protein